MRIVGEDFTTEIAQSAGLVEARFPESAQETQNVESILADALQQLSLHEQEQLTFEKHGLSVTRHDDPDNVDEILKEFHDLLDNHREEKSTTTRAYDEAMRMNPSYVTNQKFRLLFLRCVDFNVKEAVDLIINHFELKKEVFGREYAYNKSILGRDVRFVDLSTKDQDYLRKGAIQIMEKREAGGRTIMCTSPGAVDPNATYESMVSPAKTSECAYSRTSFFANPY